MKNNRKIALAIYAGLLASIYSASGTAQVPSRKLQCQSEPCSNTATGEDPQTVALRNARAQGATIKASANDAARWESSVIFSSDRKRSDLSIDIVSSPRLTMELQPDRGILSFSLFSKSQSFAIALPPKTNGDVCPNYQLQVIQGDRDYALIKKICEGYRYLPGKYHMSSEYFLYDRETVTMRSIWTASAFEEHARFPDADPSVSVKKIDHGYSLAWRGLYPEEKEKTPRVINNIFIKKLSQDGKKILVCKDARSGLEEGDLCEGQVLKRR